VGTIEIDISSIQAFLALPPDMMLLKMLLTVGWIPVAIVFLWGAWSIWVDYIQNKWAATQKFVFLAIDIPRGNMQSPKAVENIFTYLLGAHGSKNLIEKYWDGQFQLSFSLEIVSIDGYTQFLVHTPAAFKNLVESAIYSQYPDAEITEVNDYTGSVPKKYPDPEFDLAGAEFILTGSDALPIKTYEEFITSQGKPEEQFKDPMATLMDLYSSLKKGEQLWFQIVITPIGVEWIEKSDKAIRKILGEKIPNEEDISDKFINIFLWLLDTIGEFVYGLWGELPEKKEEKKDDVMRMFNLKPKERKQVEAIQKKSSKLAYEFKARLIYVSKKDVMVKPKAFNGFVGYMKQFTDIDLNSLKPDMAVTGTSASYLFKNQRINSRKNKIIRNYINRSVSAGRTPGILNVEELATLWHFPVESVVKAPMIQKAPGRKAEPPMSLPFAEGSSSEDLFGTTAVNRDIFDKIDDELRQESSEQKKTFSPNSSMDQFFPNKKVVDISNLQASNKIDTQELEPLAKGAPPSNLPFA